MKQSAILWVTLLLVSTNVVSTQAEEVKWTKQSSGWVAEIIYTKPAANVKEMVVSDFVGDMDFRGTESGDAKVVIEFWSHERDRDRAEKDLEQIRPTVQETDDGFHVRGESNRRWRWSMDQSFDLSATLPKSCEIDAETSGGDVTVNSFVSNVAAASSGGDLDVTDVMGNVDISTSGGDIDLAKITGEVSAATSGGDISFTTIKGSIEVATSGGDIDGDDLLGDLDGSTSGGDVEVNKGKLGRLSLATSGGDMNGSGLEVERGAAFSTSGGDIELANCIGEFDLSTHGGDLEAFDHQGMLNMHTSAGDIAAHNLKGGIVANTGHGSIEVSVADYDVVDFSVFELNAANGDIQLDLPKNFNAFVDATVSSVWDDDDGMIQSDFPLKISHLGGKAGTTAVGKINDGGQPIELSTVRGEIHIRKR
ncbi:DUF4097 domain-containing protein [bacterium]|nr:DUF4097 domain-containing protein [bacterium]